ncbi:uncharacterized protein LOC118738206 [Rhagoletis pomonella]|uniref:uncharacterized protein LOC118738206 n=1 Tax=Rhagoletis pomonella TaxID=28610 RepID=UPI0017811067|nr:uncharacterized protein LOC118738206 [Rhagoletis pomonella]
MGPKEPSVKATFADVTKAPTCQADIGNGVKLGLLPKGYPKALWSLDQLQAIQTAILEEVRRQRKGSVKPKFSGCTFRPGWMSIGCGDAETLEWLRKVSQTLKPWKGAEIVAMNATDVPKPSVYVGYFPEPSTTPVDSILGLVEGQNEGLRVGSWRVLNRVQKGPTTGLTLAVDPHSAETLDRLGYLVNYGYGRVRIHKKGKTTESSDPKGTQPAIASSSSTAQSACFKEGPCGSKDVPKGLQRLPSE